MALLNILQYPDPRLRLKAEPVQHFNAELGSLVDDMFETLYADNGVGLAAIQINVQQRVIVIDASEDRQQPICLINPEIISLSGKKEFMEGCLSVPDIFEKITRAEKVHVRFFDRHGKPQELHAEELLGECIQHEIDHLNGKLFVDYLSPLKRERISKKLDKIRRIRL